ncbi:hypothetical protein HDU76_005322 [Blyttiomyces sp. JEL0837]|nr:hypothetical protein HDU76_005322 [Blyttiomyces sp. JEL0837]
MSFSQALRVQDPKPNKLPLTPRQRVLENEKLMPSLRTPTSRARPTMNLAERTEMGGPFMTTPPGKLSAMVAPRGSLSVSPAQYRGHALWESPPITNKRALEKLLKETDESMHRNGNIVAFLLKCRLLTRYN